MDDGEKLKTLYFGWRQAVLTFAPRESARDVRWTKFINEVTALFQRLAGPLPPPR